VEELNTQDQGALRAQLDRARERLDRLRSDLQEIDGELESLSTERQQHRLIEQACGALDDLESLGGAELFWGDRFTPEQRTSQLRMARGRVDAFQKQLDEIEERRQVVVGEITLARDEADFIEDDLLEAERREEEKKLEWVVEREIDFPARPSVMPWSRGGEDDQRFRKSLAAALLLSLLFGLVFPMIDLPVADRWEPIEVPDRFARLIREEKPVEPPPVKQEARTQEEKEPEATEEVQELAKETTPEPAPKKPTATKEPASKGILAFREKFSALAEDETPSRLGAQARVSRAGEKASGRATRALVATQTPGSSGGIDVGSLSRDVGGGGGEGIAAVEVAKATSSIGSIGGGERPLSNGPGASRTDEEIQIVFDRHKAALYRLYNRELRKNPTLKGQMVLRIRIEPDGSVSLCELQSSDMDAPQLAAQVVGRVETFDFGAKEDIPPVTILYPIDFLPAT
jgi:hypothetical protein